MRERDKDARAIWKQMFHLYQFQLRTVMQSYHKRSNVETTFSMIKAKFGDCAAKQDQNRANQ